MAGGYGRGEKFGEKALYSVLVITMLSGIILEVLSSVECLALGSKGSQTQIFRSQSVHQTLSSAWIANEMRRWRRLPCLPSPRAAHAMSAPHTRKRMHKRPPRLIVLREVLKCVRAITRVAGKLYVAGGLGLKEPKEPDIVWVLSLHSPTHRC